MIDVLILIKAKQLFSCYYERSNLLTCQKEKNARTQRKSLNMQFYKSNKDTETLSYNLIEFRFLILALASFSSGISSMLFFNTN